MAQGGHDGYETRLAAAIAVAITQAEKTAAELRKALVDAQREDDLRRLEQTIEKLRAELAEVVSERNGHLRELDALRIDNSRYRQSVHRLKRALPPPTVLQAIEAARTHPNTEVTPPPDEHVLDWLTAVHAVLLVEAKENQ